MKFEVCALLSMLLSIEEVAAIEKAYCIVKHENPSPISGLTQGILGTSKFAEKEAG